MKKEVKKIMILLTILAIILAILIVVGVLCLSIGGAAFLIIFADVFVCALVIAFIIKKLFFKKKG